MERRNLAIHWEIGERVRRCLKRDSMLPDLYKFVPQKGRLMMCIECIPIGPGFACPPWKPDPKVARVGLVVDLDKLPEQSRFDGWFGINEKAVSSFEVELQKLEDEHGHYEMDEIRWRMRKEKDRPSFVENPDLVLIAQRIRGLSKCVPAIWVESSDGKLPGAKVMQDINGWSAYHDRPVLTFDPSYAGRGLSMFEEITLRLDAWDSRSKKSA